MQARRRRRSRLCDSEQRHLRGPLGEGNHTFQVEASNANGTGSAASYPWKVDLTPPTITIVNHPSDPAPPMSLHLSTPSDGEQLELSSAAWPRWRRGLTSAAAPRGRSYSDLSADGTTPSKFAPPTAGNQSCQRPQPCALRPDLHWTVDHRRRRHNPARDDDRHETAGPERQRHGLLHLSRRRGRSTFECKLDGAAFTSCDPQRHHLHRPRRRLPHLPGRATDPSNNTDRDACRLHLQRRTAEPPPLPPPHRADAPRPSLPETTISLKPPQRPTTAPRPSASARAMPASTFRCKVDGAPSRRVARRSRPRSCASAGTRSRSKPSPAG